MRTGYAIHDRHEHGWLHTRMNMDGVSVPVTIYVEDEEDAMVFHKLKDARAMLKVIRKDHRRPEQVRILNFKGRVVS